MDNFRKNIYRTKTQDSIPPVELYMFNSVDIDGNQYLNIINGEIDEVIDLSFQMYNYSEFELLHFDYPVSVSDLTSSNLDEIGIMTLDSSGIGISSYELIPIGTGAYCVVTVIGRSSGLPEGIGMYINIAS